MENLEVVDRAKETKIGGFAWTLIVVIPILGVGFAVWACIPLPSAFQGWANANLALQSVGLAIVMHRGFLAQAEAKSASATGKSASPLHVLGAILIGAWALAGLTLLLGGGVLKPVHAFIALELGSILPILSYAIAKAAGWNGRLRGIHRVSGGPR